MLWHFDRRRYDACYGIFLVGDTMHVMSRARYDACYGIFLVPDAMHVMAFSSCEVRFMLCHCVQGQAHWWAMCISKPVWVLLCRLLLELYNFSICMMDIVDLEKYRASFSGLELSRWREIVYRNGSLSGYFCIS